jgi:hypothetical protein
MTRSRLTATEILHGARAYSHNASRRAHQLSGPKRARVMHEPQGNPFINMRPDAERAGACEHGYLVCKTCWHGYLSARPDPKPCAPAVQPIPAPPGERDPYEAAGHPWARVGMKVKHAPGVAYQDSVVRTVIVSPLECFDYRNNVHTNWGWAETARYIPAPIAEAPAVESDPIADCERLGMWFTESTSGQGWNVRTNVFIAVRHADNITDKAEAAGAALLAYASRGKP